MKTQGNRENVLSPYPYALWGLAGPRRRRTSCVRRLFLLRRSPSKVRSVMPLHRLLIGLYDYQACSVGLKMDVYRHRRQESRSQSTVNRSVIRYLSGIYCIVARNRDWAAVTASLCILAHVAQSCGMQAARTPKSRSSTCMWSARRESGTLCRFVFARLRSFRVVLCRPFSFL